MQRCLTVGLSAASLAFTVGAAPSVAGSVERRTPRPGAATTRVVPVVAQRTTRDAFDWTDAAIGAAAVLGLSLLVTGTALVALRRAQRRVLLDIDPRRKEHDD